MQYLYLSNAQSGNGTTTGKISGSGGFNTNVQMNAVMFNAALRYNKGFLHPYIGAGTGGAFGNLGFNVNATGPAIGVFGEARSAEFGTTASQVFAGFDYDITRNFYAGVSGIFFFSDTFINQLLVPTAANVSTHQMAGMAHVGWKF